VHESKLAIYVYLMLCVRSARTHYSYAQEVVGEVPVVAVLNAGGLALVGGATVQGERQERHTVIAVRFRRVTPNFNGVRTRARGEVVRASQVQLLNLHHAILQSGRLLKKT
jgi:hypothetical protein